MFKMGGVFNIQAKELLELLPRFKVDNIFVSGKFKKRFPDFKITSYHEGIAGIMNNERTKTTIMKVLEMARVVMKELKNTK